MAIVTTKSLADPKPVRPVDWTGHILPEGKPYAGGDPRYSDSNGAVQDAPGSPVKAPPTRRKRKRALMSPEARKAFGERMRAYWATKRPAPSAVDTQSIVHTPDSPSVAIDGG
jgi:hypothetical protein